MIWLACRRRCGAQLLEIRNDVPAMMLDAHAVAEARQPVEDTVSLRCTLRQLTKCAYPTILHINNTHDERCAVYLHVHTYISIYF